MTSLVQTIWGNDWIFYSYGLNVVVSQISMTEQLLFFPRTVPLQPACILMLHFISTAFVIMTKHIFTVN